MSAGQTISVADINAGRLKFTPAANANGTGYAAFTFQVRDNGGTANGGVRLDPTPNTLTIDVTATNDAPTVTTSPGSASFTEGDNIGSAPVAVDAALTLADADSPTLASASVAITAGFQGAEDALAFANTDAAAFGNIAATYDAGTGVLTLGSAGASATLAQWQNALRAVTYGNASEDPDGMDRAIAFSVNDGASVSAVALRALTVTPVNDAPTIGTIANQAVDEDTPSAPLAFTIGDTDSVIGSLVLAATSSDQALIPDANLVLGGSGANRTIAITPAPNQNGGPVTITLTLSDGTTSVQTAFDLVVTSINDAPSANPVNASGDADGVVPIALSATDVDGGVTSFALLALPANGGLYLDAAQTAAARVGTDYAASGNELTLYFAPVAGWSGATEFQYVATDDQGERSAPATATVGIAGAIDSTPGIEAGEEPAPSAKPEPDSTEVQLGAATTSPKAGAAAPLQSREPTASEAPPQAPGKSAAAPVDGDSPDNVSAEIQLPGLSGDPSESRGESPARRAPAAAAEGRATARVQLQVPASPALLPQAVAPDVQAVMGLDFQPRPGAAAAAALEEPAFRDGLDRLREAVAAESDLDRQVLGVSVGAGAGLSVGYVLWLLRGGVLVASLMSSLPAWLVVDPLPILARTRKRDGDESEEPDDESLEDLVGADAAPAPGAEKSA